MTKAIAVFDIGKTNKKFLLFSLNYELLLEEEIKFEEAEDDEGFPCDDIEKIELWVRSILKKILEAGKFEITCLNFSTYGATLVFLDEKGKRCAPVYNYLKPLEKEIKEKFLERYNKEGDFFRRTASPDLDLLNSGLQIFRLKELKPEQFKKVKHILHLPNYISYLFTGQFTSEYTSIGCHTALWDYDRFAYDNWLSKEGIELPLPDANHTLCDISFEGKKLKAGIGIHDSSASLVPYLKSGEEFILLSTGTWCINMNPYNNEPLTKEELQKDCLCYLSTRQKQVKSSRFFMGHIHDHYLEIMNSHFNLHPDAYKIVKPDFIKHSEWKNENRRMFDAGLKEVDLRLFTSFDEAYNRLVFDLTVLEIESLKLVIPGNNSSGNIYITGGFSNNSIFTSLIANAFPSKNVFISEIKNASALGAAMAVGPSLENFDAGMRRINNVI